MNDAEQPDIPDQQRPTRGRPTRRGFERYLLVVVVLLQGLILYKLFAPHHQERPAAASEAEYAGGATPPPSQYTMSAPTAHRKVTAASLQPQQNVEDCAEAEARALIQQLMLIRDGGTADPSLARMLERDLEEAQFVHRQMDRLFNTAMRDFQQFDALFKIDEGWPALAPSPALDMRNLENHYLVMFSLPGICSDDVQLRLDGRILTLTCQADDLQRPSFERRVMLPGEIDQTRDTQAHLTNGVLKVFLPKTFEALAVPPVEENEKTESPTKREML